VPDDRLAHVDDRRTGDTPWPTRPVALTDATGNIAAISSRREPDNTGIGGKSPIDRVRNVSGNYT
jgi:hypothetical protein